MLKISFDGSLDIAAGKSRREKVWKNRQIKWSELVKKLSVTHRTAETYQEYISSKRDRQDEIKDVGGFVGGYLTNGRRGTGNVAHRQLITLDIDNAAVNMWDDFTLMYGCAACVYTTHKHSADKPRIRLVIPLDREIMADEYEPICRRIAEGIGIEAFTDVTTYEATRLMYWPSTAKDGEFFSAYQDGAWLSADEILNSYRNWRDSSEWPVCSGELEKVKHDIKKQEDPTEKKGIIGAFCRVYGIHDVIAEYLSEVYTNGVVEDRFTYVHGSTANGLVVYEDKWAFSHHGSDPCSGKLCNAFDLVRLHKFGELEEKASLQTMMDFARKDREVSKQLALESFEAAREDFQPMAGIEPGEGIEEIEVTEEELKEWLGELERDKKGNCISSINNIYKALSTDPKLKGRLYFDEFENWLKIKGNLPWRAVRKDTQDFSDDDADCLDHYLECYSIPFTYRQKAISLIKTDNRIHPVKQYIESLFWDGVERLDTLLIDYLGAEDTRYVRSATRKTFVGAIARIFEPGVKFDTVLTLLGEEGIGKSSIAYRMAGNGKWFSDSLGNIHDKSGMESLRGIWIMEVPELSAFNRADEEAIKRFIASQVDVYRPAYGRQQVRYPRQCIFIATSNKNDFLKGAHKHRRFLPIAVNMALAKKDWYTELVGQEIDQIWAEAHTRYSAGESLDMNKEEKELAAKVREQHAEIDERGGVISEFLNLPVTEDWEEKCMTDRISYIRSGFADEFAEEKGTIERTAVCTAEIWCELFERRRSELTTQNTKFIHDIMKKMKGWEYRSKVKRFGDYGPQNWYEKSVILNKS